MTELPTLSPTEETSIATPAPTIVSNGFGSDTTTSTTEFIEECIYVWWDDIFPIIIGNNGNDYCVQNIISGQSYNFFCSDNELWSHLWRDNADCYGVPNVRGLAMNYFLIII